MKTNHIHFLKTLSILLLLTAGVTTLSAQSIWNRSHLDSVKVSLSNPSYSSAFEALINRADELLDVEPLSVMMKEKTPASGDMHDYMSQARYFWPDPTKPDGLPYINRDGISNPELNKLDRVRLGETAERIKILSLAYYFTADEKYASKAVDLIRIWFLNEDTMMNPNLEYAQMIPGHNNGKGRCYGILDTYSFVEMLDAVALLEESKAFTDSDDSALKKWFETLLEWILTSQQGKDEAASVNNHGTAFDAQVIAFALYAGRDDIARKIIEEFPYKRTYKQITPDGRQPHELSRTLAYHYSHYNLTHYIDIFLMAQKLGMDIDDKTSGDGRNFYKAVDFLAPFIAEGGQERWPYEQIHGFDDVSQKLCKDIYRIAVYIAPERQDYLEIFNRHARIPLGDPFNLLY